MIKEDLGLPANTGFEKTILMLYFNDKRGNVVSKVSDETKKAIGYVYAKIKDVFEA